MIFENVHQLSYRLVFVYLQRLYNHIVVQLMFDNYSEIVLQELFVQEDNYNLMVEDNFRVEYSLN
jgi:hypothetical protein